jgi:hypothetical protein
LLAPETWDREVELEFAGEDDRGRVRLAECGAVRFEGAVPARSGGREVSTYMRP